MDSENKLIPKTASYSLPVQCALFCAAIFASVLRLGAASGWVFVASLLAGLVAFISGIVASVITRRVRWLGLSATALFIAFFSLLIGIALSGGAGV